MKYQLQQMKHVRGNVYVIAYSDMKWNFFVGLIRVSEDKLFSWGDFFDSSNCEFIYTQEDNVHYDGNDDLLFNAMYTAVRVMFSAVDILGGGKNDGQDGKTGDQNYRDPQA